MKPWPEKPAPRTTPSARASTKWSGVRWPETTPSPSGPPDSREFRNAARGDVPVAEVDRRQQAPQPGRQVPGRRPGQAPHQGRPVESGIRKRPVAGETVWLDSLNLDGDRVLTTFTLREAFNQRFRERLESGLPTSILYRFELARDRLTAEKHTPAIWDQSPEGQEWKRAERHRALELADVRAPDDSAALDSRADAGEQ